MKLFISASLISVMVFYSSLVPFLHSFSLYFSSTIHKNYMFLICNGLLVIIFKNSGLIRKQSLQNNAERSGRVISEAETEALGAATMEDSRKLVEDGDEIETGSVSEREESEVLVTEMEDEEKDLMILLEDEEEEEEEEEEENGSLSKDELNRKCEEFIRKMKAGIKFESQQQQLLVF